MQTNNRPEIKTVLIMKGFEWITQGFKLSTAYPKQWLVIMLAWFVAMQLFTLVPVLSLLFNLFLSNVIVAGIYYFIFKQRNSQANELQHVFVGFKHRTLPLIGSNLLQILLLFVLASISVKLINLKEYELEQFLELIGGQVAEPDEALVERFASFIFTMFGCAITAMLVFLFVPVLLIMHPEVNLMEAVKLSALACFKNIIALSFYGLTLFMLLVVVVLMFAKVGLSIVGLLLLLPVIFNSVYLAYKDIFHFQQVAQNRDEQVESDDDSVEF